MRGVQGLMSRISKIFLRLRQFYFVLADKRKELTTRYTSKADLSWILFEASSKLEKYGNVAEMVERSLCMREVRGSMPRISKTFSGFENSIWCLLIMGRNWQLVTNRKLIYHGFCSEASSKLEEHGDVAQLVELSLRMRGVQGLKPRIARLFLRLRQFYFVLTDKRKELTTRYKSKPDLSSILFTSYLEAWRARGRSSNGRALASHARGTGIDAPHLQTFLRFRQFYFVLADNGKNWQLVTNRKLIIHEFFSEASSKLEEYGNVAEMVERSLCMREVRGSMPRISKTFSGFDNSIWCLLIMGRNWQLGTNRKLISWILFRS